MPVRKHEFKTAYASRMLLTLASLANNKGILVKIDQSVNHKKLASFSQFDFFGDR